MPAPWSPRTWLRLTFRFSTSLQTWHERTGDLVAVGGFALGLILTLVFRPGWSLFVLLWLACLAPAFVLNRLGWLKIFGPVLFYDMVRQSRRGRFILLRFLYVLLLVFLLLCVSAQAWDRRLDGPSTTEVASRIAQDYFEVLMVAQFITVVLLTPAYVGGAIAEERDRKTLEFMLATDLLNREIVFGKLGSRMANLGLVVLTSLPLLSILQFLGGIEPALVVAGFLLTALAIIGLAAVTILFSTISVKPREAIMLAYLVFVLYYVSATLFWAVGLRAYGATPVWFTGNVYTVAELFSVVNSGNLIAVLGQIKIAGATGTLASDLPGIVGSYAAFNLIVAFAAVTFAVARLRRSALADTGRTPRKAGRWRSPVRPAVGDFPMVWKEVYCEGGNRRSRVAWIVLFTLMVCVSFTPAVLILWQYLDTYSPYQSYDNLARSMNAWVRGCNAVVGFLTIMGVATRAAGSFTSERDRDTYDTLLTTPLDSNAILYGKWVGSMLSNRWGFIWLASIWGLAMITGGMYPLALPFVMLSWFIYAGFFATLGLWFSILCRSSLRAITFTIFSALALCFLHWVPWMCCAFMNVPGGGMELEVVAQAQAGVMTPPFVLGYAPFREDSFDRGAYSGRNEEIRMAVFSLCGLLIWSGAWAGLYVTTSMRLRVLTHRGRGLTAARPFWENRQASDAARRRRRLGADHAGADADEVHLVEEGETELPEPFEVPRRFEPPKPS